LFPAEAAHALDGLRIRVRAEYRISFAEKINEVTSETAPRIQDDHPWLDAASQELVKKIDVDLAELLLKVGHGT